MKKYTLLLWLACSAASYAQTFEDLKDKKDRNVYEDGWFAIMLRYTHVSGKANYKIGGLTGNINIRHAKIGKGEISGQYENVTLGDMIWLLGHLDRDKDIDHAFGAGWLGWFQGYYNVVSNDKLIVSPGISLCDYIFGSNVKTEIAPGAFSNEPFGYYFTAGPSIRTSYLINKDFWVDGIATLDIPYAHFKHGSTANVTAEKDYPNPFFANVSATVFHKSRLFFGVRFSRGIDRGDNGGSASRTDVSLGYQFLK